MSEEYKIPSLHHSASVPLLNNGSLELKSFSNNVKREQISSHYFDDGIDKTPKSSRKFAGLFGKSSRELHSDYPNISLHQVKYPSFLRLNGV